MKVLLVTILCLLLSNLSFGVSANDKELKNDRGDVGVIKEENTHVSNIPEFVTLLHTVYLIKIGLKYIHAVSKLSFVIHRKTMLKIW
jgi:hypothetical protein